jgi:predicted dehydrogenase
MTPVRLAIVGCGAIAELGHLPGAMRCRDVEITVLVDRDESRAWALAQRFAIARVETDYSRLAGLADAACVALPPHLHRHSAETLLGSGLHVLMEKPLATNVADCDAMVAAATANNRTLAVAMMRRFARSSRYLKALVESGMLGRIERYTARSGAADAWPSRSPFTFSAAQSGGGALISNGCHDVDLMQWLLGPIERLEFFSDSGARMEGNCLLECQMVSGAAATIEVSRTRTLANTIFIEGERGSVEAPVMGEEVTILPAGGGRDLLNLPVKPPLDYPGVMASQLSDFAAAVRGARSPLVDGTAGRDMLALVERCYSIARPMELTWDLPVRGPAVT